MAKKKRSFVGRSFRAAGKLFLLLFGLSLVYLVLCKWIMPPITITQLSAWVSGDGLRRDYVSGSEIAPCVKLAAIASEDQLFAEHGGFDWKAIEKSLDRSKQTRKRKRKALGSAASTISQQTAKNVFLWQGSGVTRYLRKVPEVFYTKMIEWVWGKDRIMEVYLNTIEMGRGIYGIEAAAQTYFGRPAAKLSKIQAAQIIACLPNPKVFTVVPMSRRVSARAPKILRQMNNLEGDPDVAALIH